MFKFIIFLGLFAIVFDLLTRSYLNPYKLIMIFGKKGSGKTTTLTALAIKYINKGRKVYSTVNIPGTYYFDVEEIGKRTFDKESVVLIDEVGMIWDARDFSKFPKAVRDFFKYQRQYKLTVYLFSQTFDIDKKIRDLTDEMWLLKNFMRVFSMQRRIIKTITISSGADGTSNLTDQYKFDSILGGIKFIFIPRYTAFFQSYNPKKLTYIEGMYMDLNDVQEEYLKTSGWLIGQFKIGFIKAFHAVGRILKKLKGGFVEYD